LTLLVPRVLPTANMVRGFDGEAHLGLGHSGDHRLVPLANDELHRAIAEHDPLAEQLHESPTGLDRGFRPRARELPDRGDDLTRKRGRE